MKYKVDFHTHTTASPDGSLHEADFRRVFDQGILDCVAVTDHNTTEMAQRLHEVFGDRIIVGEEITTIVGEIIGLYLSKAVPPMLGLEETVAHIKAQGGLVYVPHPFETVRKGLQPADVLRIVADVDIIEVHNGRALFQNRSPLALDWSKQHRIPGAASSDSHGYVGWGRTYTILEAMPSKATLAQQLSSAAYEVRKPSIRSVLYPKFNRLRRRFQ